VAFLPAKTLGLDHRDALEANFVQRLLHFVEFEGFDNRFNFFHGTKALVIAEFDFSRSSGPVRRSTP